MIRTLKNLIGIHHKRDATAVEIEGALAGARVEIEAAGRAHSDADAAYRAGLLRLDESELQGLIADKEAAAIRRDRAIALVEALTGRLSQACEAEEQSERRRRYDTAERAQVAAAKALAAEYPKLARALVEVLRTVAEADALAEAANQALPDGTERLLPVEARVRTEARSPERITAQEEFTAWCRTGGERLAPADEATVKPNPDKRTGTWKPIGGEPVPVVLRRFRRITRQSEVPGLTAPSLASSLNLPGLRAAHIPFWQARDDVRTAASIVAMIDEAAPSWGKTVGRTLMFDPDTMVEVVDLDAPAAIAA